MNETFESTAPHASQTSDESRPSLSEQSKKIARDVRELGEIAMDSASHAVDDLRHKGSEAVEHGRERAVEARGDFERYVVAQPLKAMAYALGTGMLLGILARR